MESYRLAAPIRSAAFFAIASLLAAPALLPAAAVMPLSLTNQGTVPANDDGFVGPVALNIGGASGINFFGVSTTSVFVNNNGNVTFQSGLSQYTPNGLATGVGQPIIAPFFADVDTRGPGSGLVTYGNSIYNGHAAFVVNYPHVGYFDSHADKVNTFQLILSDRADTGSGNFDVEFNYDSIQWETGDASSGSGGLGGVSAAVGYSNGQGGSSNVFYQLDGSLVNGALIDGGVDALIGHSVNSDIGGRYDFQVRNGAVLPTPPPTPTPGPTPDPGPGPGTATPEPASLMLLAAGLGGCYLGRKKLRQS